MTQEADSRLRARRGRRAALALGLTGATALAVVAPVGASSHREAPLISQDPVADNTDTYAWTSRPGFVTLAANFVPAEDPAAGPNYFRFGDDVLYELKVDSDGDAVEDITFEFRFETTVQNPDNVIAYAGEITALDDDAYNLRQTYTVTKVEDGRRTDFASGTVPPNNVGPKTTPDYPTLAAGGVTSGPDGSSAFAGQREDPFYGDIGAVFDGVNPRSVSTTDTDGNDFFAGYNVHSIAVEVPTASLQESAQQPVIGVWSTTSRSKVRVFYQDNSSLPTNRGRYVQTSRLGNPLVNEVVIPLGLKDAFNNLAPANDAATLSRPDPGNGITIPVVQDPQLARILAAEPFNLAVPPAPRNDLVQVFLTGVPDVTAVEGGTPAEVLRLNTSTPPTPDADISRLGVPGGDNAGFPNGRRPVDDVVDIGLSAVRGTVVDPQQYPPIGDGVPANDVAAVGAGFLPTFPYLGTPFQGFAENNETRTSSQGTP